MSRSPRNRRITESTDPSADVDTLVRQNSPRSSTPDIHADRILILDFGSQYTQLIARRVREAGVYCEIRPYDMDPDALTSFGAKGIVLSGGPESVTVDTGFTAPAVVFELGVPVLGICYGMQTMASQYLGSPMRRATSMVCSSIQR
jgi:GMP synthase (glutamine-hydrolysing) A subunit